ncbi:MAG: hemerythrin domain-containing protein [Myxococcales bacterium]
MDAIVLLQQDHRTVESLFKQYEALGDRAQQAKKKVAQKIIRELAVHASIEEMLFYPAIRAAAKAKETKANEAADDLVLESLEEHHVVKWTLAELEKMNPEDERFDAKMTVLMESVRHHVEEEEQDLFPKARKMLKDAIVDLGEAMAKAKKTAPTRPHPRAPDQPPGNFVAGPVAAAMDRGRDLAAGIVDKVMKRGRSALGGKELS